MQADLPFLLQMEPNRRVNSFYVCNTESILPALLCESQKEPSNSVLAMLAGSTDVYKRQTSIFTEKAA